MFGETCDFGLFFLFYWLNLMNSPAAASMESACGVFSVLIVLYHCICVSNYGGNIERISCVGFCNYGGLLLSR